MTAADATKQPAVSEEHESNSANISRPTLQELKRGKKTSQDLPQIEPLIHAWIDNKKNSRLFRIFGKKDAYDNPRIVNVRKGGCFLFEIVAEREHAYRDEWHVVPDYSPTFYDESEIARELESKRPTQEFVKRSYSFDLSATRHIGTCLNCDRNGQVPCWTAKRPCFECGGKGSHPVPCNICGGSKRIECYSRQHYDFEFKVAHGKACSKALLRLRSKERVIQTCSKRPSEFNFEFTILNSIEITERLPKEESLVGLGLDSNELHSLFNNLGDEVGRTEAEVVDSGNTDVRSRILFERRIFKFVPVVTAILLTERKLVEFSAVGFSPHIVVKTMEWPRDEKKWPLL